MQIRERAILQKNRDRQILYFAYVSFFSARQSGAGICACCNQGTLVTKQVYDPRINFSFTIYLIQFTLFMLMT